MYTVSETRTLGEKLHVVVREAIGVDLQQEYQPGNLKTCPIDIQPENFHKRKSEFTAELAFIRNWLAQMETFGDFLNRDSRVQAGDESVADFVDFLNGWARSDSKHVEAKTSEGLAVNNAMRVGLVPCLLKLSENIRPILQKRLDLLERQEQDYWSVPHRPPNYHARTIALRLAKLYASETGERPTIGISGETAEPSTKYGRALQQTFDVLAIAADFRGPGEWAVSQITGADLEPPNRSNPLDVLREAHAAGFLKKRSLT
jgi:hypothetical protein